MQSIAGLHVQDAPAFSPSERRRCSQEVTANPKEPFFKMPPQHPTPPLGVRYSLAIWKSNVELFQISQSSFPFSNIPSDKNKAFQAPS